MRVNQGGIYHRSPLLSTFSTLPGAPPLSRRLFWRDRVGTLNSAISLAPATHWVAHPSRTLRRVGVGNTCATWFVMLPELETKSQSSSELSRRVSPGEPALSEVEGACPERSRRGRQTMTKPYTATWKSGASAPRQRP
jgi:hypothetical protein